MNKRSLAILELAYAAEIAGAMTNSPGLLQVKNKVATQLAADGYLEAQEVTLPGRFPVVLRGYALTHAGRLTYCTSDLCDGEPA